MRMSNSVARNPAIQMLKGYSCFWRRIRNSLNTYTHQISQILKVTSNFITVLLRTPEDEQCHHRSLNIIIAKSSISTITYKQFCTLRTCLCSFLALRRHVEGRGLCSEIRFVIPTLFGVQQTFPVIYGRTVTFGTCFGHSCDTPAVLKVTTSSDVCFANLHVVVRISSWLAEHIKASTGGNKSDWLGAS